MPASQFSSSGEMVAGTLRGYRAWSVREIRKPTGRIIRKPAVDPYEEEFTTFCNPSRIVARGPEFITEEEYTTELVLGSVSANAVWENPTLVAGCTRNQGDRFIFSDGTISCGPGVHAPAPDPSCSCGIYGWYTPEVATQEHTGWIIGVIEISGKVLLGTEGFRAEKAEIKALTVNPLYASDVRKAGTVIANLVGQERYNGVDICMDAEQMFSKYPPDFDTLLNLGITPEREGPEEPQYGVYGSSWSSGNTQWLYSAYDSSPHVGGYGYRSLGGGDFTITGIWT